jgi:hypothetical protein
VYLKTILGERVAWSGMAGALLALVAFYRRALLPAALLALGLAAFVVLGAGGLPLLARYELVPAAMLALFCAVALVGWTMPVPRRARAGLAVAALVAIVAVATGAGADRRRLEAVRAATDGRQLVERQVREAVRAPGGLRAARECRHITVAGFRMVPLVALWSGRRVNDVSYLAAASAPPAGMLVLVRPSQVPVGWLLTPAEARVSPVPAGAAFAASSSGFAVYRRC